MAPAALEDLPPKPLASMKRKGAPFVIGPTNPKPMRPTHALPRDLIENARAAPKVDFDAEKHLVLQPPKRVYTMEEWGLEGEGISPIASSDPFPLYSEEAVQQIRRELFSDEVLDTCQFSSTFTKNMLRGYYKMTPFSTALWKSEEMRQIVSSVAGIELELAFDYEIGNVNILVNNGKEDQQKEADADVGFSWHYDSFPFVCVTMLSDCTGMQGGETAVRTGNGDIMKVRGPTMGTAVILQGRYIQHAALKAKGGKERITMITPFRPRDPLVRDELVLTGSRPISHYSGLLYGYTHYRAELLEARMRHQAKQLKKAEEAGKPFNPQEVKDFLEEQKEFIEATIREMY